MVAKNYTALNKEIDRRENKHDGLIVRNERR